MSLGYPQQIKVVLYYFYNYNTFVFFNTTESSFTSIDSSGPVTPFISGSNCVQCHWDPPFSLTPIPGYIYNVTNKDSGNTTSITNTDYKYCPSQYGQHSFSVAANNTVGQGIVTRETVNIPTCKKYKIIIYSCSNKQAIPCI